MRLNLGAAIAAVTLAATAALVAAAGPATAAVASTTAPARVHVGAAYMEFPFTITTGTADDEVLGVSLTDPSAGFVAGDLATQSGPQTWAVRVALYARELPSWGVKHWDIDAVSSITGDPEPYRADVEFRAHSLIGLSKVTRRATAVTLVGSARVYDTNRDAYLGWTTQIIMIERKITASRWDVVGAGHADWRGDFTTTVTVPHGATLRARIAGTSSKWGCQTHETWI